MINFLSTLVIGQLLFASSNAQNSSTSEIVPLLRSGYLVPQILPAFNATVGPFNIVYPKGIVNYGNSLNLSTVKYAPSIEFPSEAQYPGAKYTVAMIDPDAPTPQNPTESDIRHWLVADVSPSTSLMNISTGNVLSSYLSPSPPSGSAAHRYTQVLLRQPTGANITVGTQSGVTSFNFTQFIAQNSLVVVSANYFNATFSNASTSATSQASSGSSGVPAATQASQAITLSTPLVSILLCMAISVQLLF